MQTTNTLNECSLLLKTLVLTSRGKCCVIEPDHETQSLPGGGGLFMPLQGVVGISDAEMSSRQVYRTVVLFMISK